MSYLDTLENKSVYLLRETYSRFRNTALLWSMGKDSTTLLWLCRKAFFGKIPFPVIHIDTGLKFREIYDFRDHYSRKWDLDLIISKNYPAIVAGTGPEKSKFDCCNSLKTLALKNTIEEYDLKALMLAIRRDEHGIRAKERYFSPRSEDFRWNYHDQPTELWEFYQTGMNRQGHFRIHPLLHWREIDVWKYILRERIPVNTLYFAQKGLRYRSIGCRTCCEPVFSKANSVRKIIKELEKTDLAERSGRAQDKEDVYTMQKLRSLGYM